MSTHCTIKVQDSAVSIFKHYDGYPDEMIPLLTKYIKEFDAKRGLGEPDMFLAYLIYRLKQDEFNEQMERNKNKKFKSTTTDATGYRLFADSEFQSEEYNYLIDDQGRIFCNGREMSKEEDGVLVEDANEDVISFTQQSFVDQVGCLEAAKRGGFTYDGFDWVIVQEGGDQVICRIK